MTPLLQPTCAYLPRLRTWRLKHDHMWAGCGLVLRVRAPFDFDLASIPRPLWLWIASHELGTLAPLYHDWLYRYGGRPPYGDCLPWRTFTRAEADALFLLHMQLSGVAWLRRWAAYLAVRLFGASSWRTR
jgi:hypothetical protein